VTALVLGNRGAPLGPQGVEDLVTKYAKLAGLQDVTPHTLRHTFAKLLLDSGVDLVTLAKLLGHERIETTAIYTTPSQQDLEQAVDRLSVEPEASQ
jgi:integrase/recombinase XerC